MIAESFDRVIAIQFDIDGTQNGCNRPSLAYPTSTKT
jgi:hypothetical protein